MFNPLLTGVLTVGISVVCGVTIGKAVLTGVAVVGVVIAVNAVVFQVPELESRVSELEKGV